MTVNNKGVTLDEKETACLAKILSAQYRQAAFEKISNPWEACEKCENGLKCADEGFVMVNNLFENIVKASGKSFSYRVGEEPVVPYDI